MADFNLLDPSTWPSFSSPAEGAPAASNAPVSEAERLQKDMRQINAALSSPDAMAALALSEQRGNGLTKDNQLLDDYQALTPAEFQQKYGVDTYRSLVATGIQQREFLATTDPERDLVQHASDAVVAAAGRIQQGAVGLASLPGHLLLDGPIKDAWFDAAGNASAEIQARTRRLQSEELNRRFEIDEMRASLDRGDSAALFETDKADDENFIDSLASYGTDFLRNAGDSGKRLLEDPQMLENIIAEGAGSLAVGSVAAKAAGAAATGGRIIPGQGGALTSPGSQLLDDIAALEKMPGDRFSVTVAQNSAALANQEARDLATKTAFGSVIAGMEGGGSALDAQQAVMNMDPLELIKSPRYQEFLSEGMTPEEARSRLATEAAEIAVVSGAAVGAVTSKLVDKIELAPLARTNVGGLVSNIGRETLEEGIQSASGQIASNAGVRFSGANPNQDLAEGVGEAVVEGAVGGAVTTGALQGPGTALNIAGKGVVAGAGMGLTAAAKLVGAGSSLVMKRAETIQAEREASSPVSVQNVAPAVETAVAEAPVVAEALQTLAAEAGSNAPEVQSYIDRVVQASQIQEADLDYMPDVVGEQLSNLRNELGRMPNRFEALDLAAKTAGDEAAVQADRVGAAIYILKQIETNQKLFAEDWPEFMEKVPQDRAEFKKFAKYANILDSISQTPAIRDALDWAKTEMQQPDNAGPVDARLAAQTVDLAVHAPLAMNEAVADQLLNQNAGDTTTLTPEQRRILQGAKALKQAAKTYAAEGQSPKDGVDFVSKQIEVDGGSKGHQLSLVQHAKSIAAAQASGNMDLVKERVTKLNRFALSHRNKVGAANRSIQNGDGKNVPYTAADAEGAGYMNKKGWGVIVGNAGSERAARVVHAEALAIAALSNSFAALYPELGIAEVKVPDLRLDQALEANQADTKEERSTPAPAKAEDDPAPARATTTETGDTTSRQEETERSSSTSQPAQETSSKEDAATVAPTGDTDNVVAKSRITPEQAIGLSDAGLRERILSLTNKQLAKVATAEDNATYAVLEAEQVARDIANQEVAREEATRQLNEIDGDIEGARQDLAFVEEQQADEAKISDAEQRIEKLLERRAEFVAKNSDVLATEQKSAPAPVEPTAPAEESTGARLDTDAEEIANYIAEFDDSTPIDELTVAEAFPDLVQPNGENFLHKAFKLPRKRKSRMLGLLSPLGDLVQALRSPTAFEQFVEGAGIKYPSGDRDALQHALSEGGIAMRKTMVARMKAALLADKEKSWPYEARPSLHERLGKDEVINQYPENLALNIMEKTEKGYRYNQSLLETAIIAGLDWALNAADRAIEPSSSDIAQMLGVDEDDPRIEGAKEEFKRGLSMDMAARSLAENIEKFWGLESNRDTAVNYVEGIPEAMAKEVLFGLEAIGLVELRIKTRDTHVKIQGVEKDFNRVWFDTRSEDVQNFVRSLNAVSTMFTDMALIDPDTQGYQVGRPITKVDTKQLHNPMVTLSSQQTKGLKNTQATPHYPNLPVYDLIQAMGLEAFVTLFSGRPYKTGDLDKTHTEMGLNKKHWESVKGLQRSLASSYEHVEKQMARVRRYAEENGIPVHEAASYYRHHINKLGRTQMDGLSNPQSDKLAREIFMPTLSRLDLSNQDSEDFLRFLMTVGQGIGLKTEKEFRAGITKGGRQVIAEKVIAATMTEGGALRPLVEGIKTWLADKENGGGQDMAGETYAQLQAAGLSMHGIHSLIAVARYELARDGGRDLSQFETFSYLEADGKTNGPINALMLYATGVITPAWLKVVAKGGAFFGRQGKSLNSHMVEDDKDLYQEGSDGADRRVAELGREIKASSPAAHEHFMAFKRLLTALSIDVTQDPVTKDITIKRGLTKNPLTITIYGSGAGGIAGKITDELLSTMYEALSGGDKAIDGILEIYPDGSEAFFADLDRVTSKVARRNKEGEWYVTGQAEPVLRSALDLELDATQYGNLVENIGTFLVKPMRQSIESVVTDHVSVVTGATQQATQIQSIILKGMFIQKITERLALKQSDPGTYGYRKGDFLSQQELDDILENLRAFSPIIDTGSQGYFLSGGEKADLFETTTLTIGDETIKVSFPSDFSRALSGDLSTPAFTYGPTTAGVKAIPTLVVGSGDGQMMLNFLSENTKGSANRVEHVFDGLNMPADAIDEYSRLVNQSVFKTWTTDGNPVRAAYESFKAFLERSPIETLFGTGLLNDQQEVARKELTQVLANAFNVEELASPADVKVFADTLLGRMKDLADQTDARRRTYAEFPFSVDQMASAEEPYVNEGVELLPANPTYDEIADAMTARYKFHLAQIQAEQQIPPVTEGIQDLGVVDEVGARVLQAGDLPTMLKNLSGILSPTQKEMLRHAAKLLNGSGYRLVFGSTRQLDAWEQANNADRFVPGSNSQNGKIDPVSKIILISNMEAETVIHELVHAATIDKVRAFYADKNALSKEERAAVERIEGLMGEWLAQDPGLETGDGYEARRRAEAEIHRRIQKGQKAEAVNEFMAWVLGNQDLAALAQKTKVKNPAWRILGDALAALKALIWGAPNKGPRVGDSILSNLRFNTRVLINGPTLVEQLQQDANAVALFQSKSFGDSDRLSQIRERLNGRVLSWLEGDSSAVSRVTHPTRIKEALATRQLVGQVTSQFVFHFPDLKTMQAASTFSAIQRALMTEIDLNPNALSRMEDLYAHTIGQLKYTDFMADPDAVPPDPNDEQQAREKLDLVLGKLGTVTDKLGRSSLMSSFLALAMTSEQFRTVLAGKDKPKSDKSDAEGLDGLVENTANRLVDGLSLRIAGEKGKDANVRDALDNLMASMIENVGDQRTFIETLADSGLDKMDSYLANQIQDKSAVIAEKSADIARNSKNRVVKAGAVVTNAIATMINEDKATEAALGLVSRLNKTDGWNTVKELVADLVGRTRENAPIFDMISKVRATVQQVRQQFRDELISAKLNRAFTQKVSPEQWTAMFKVLGKTDLAAITGSYGLDGALNMLTDARARNSEIRKLEAKFDQKLLDKAKQLANFLVTGSHGPTLLRNAYAISALAVPGVRNLKPAPDMVEEVDRLATLYAIQQTDVKSLQMVADLITDGERAGVEFVTSYLMGQRIDELAKISTPVARINHYKGHIPSEAQGRGSLVIASASQHARLLTQGYTKVADYNGSSADRSVGKRGYYYSPVSGRAPFSQGVLQTVHQTASGVDPRTGFTVGEVMAGRIQDPQLVKLIERTLANQATTNENLLPVYNDRGQVIAFERAADPAMLAKLERSTDLASMIGVWRGRQAEELMAQEVNQQLVDRLHDIWIQDKKAGREKEFVNIAKLDPKTDDKILIEAVSLIPASAVEYIESVFGKGQFMVRRDMLLDTFGARQASIGDLFTGETRWNQKLGSDFEKVITGIMGKDAYRTLVGSEENIQELISNVKQMIVVRSVIVPAANIMSNMFQLLNRGVPLRAIVHGMGAKTAEISAYVKRRHREIDLEAELRAAKGRNDSGAALKIGNQIKSLQDSYRRMSIWPLIEAGEFSAISSGQVLAEDLAMADGKWTNWVERKVNQLPEPFRTPVRYGLVTRDTALFQGLARAVQYGDFVAKAVLYDDLTSRKKVSKEAAVATVNEAFVNYNRLAGRSRQYLESVGLLWFYNYKLRIMKEAAHMLRHNPVRSLLMMSMPGVDTVFTDNIMGKALEGTLGFSVGPGMAFGSWQLNPWINLAR